MKGKTNKLIRELRDIDISLAKRANRGGPEIDDRPLLILRRNVLSIEIVKRAEAGRDVAARKAIREGL